MDVVRSLVVIQDVQGLIHLKGKNVGQVLTALLGEDGSLGRRCIVRRTCRDINHHVLERVIRSGNNGFGSYRSGMLLGATGLLGHIDGLLFGRGAFVSDFTGNSAAARYCVSESRCGKNDDGPPKDVSEFHLLTPPECAAKKTVS